MVQNQRGLAGSRKREIKSHSDHQRDIKTPHKCWPGRQAYSR